TALSERGEHVVVTGSDKEEARARAVALRAQLPPERVLAGRTGLAELAALVAGSRLVVCADTGIAHLSYAYRTPSVVLFGPVPADWWGPPRNGPHIALSVDSARRGEPFATSPDPALLGITPSAVLSSASTLLA
ncbi:MAG TPA: glycosyltransferase family 9 protein, partial [Mycobacteriales bacterium]|nr:glycosyltransferase family 9 protein [Mycobacteriales bacterium]